MPPEPEAIVPEPFDAHEQELHDTVIDLNFRFDPDPVLLAEVPREELEIPPEPSRIKRLLRRI